LLLISEVPKVINGKRLVNINNEKVQVYRFSKSEISTTEDNDYEKYFYLIDHLTPYTTELIDTKLASYEKVICDRNVCCEFKLKTQFHESTNTDNLDYYR
jgi:hypothetical protein